MLEAGQPVTKPSRAQARPVARKATSSAMTCRRRRARETRPDRSSGRAGCGPPRRCAGWSPRPRWSPGSWCCRCSSARASTSRTRSARCPGVVQHTRVVAAEGGRRGGRARARRGDAVRHPGARRTRPAPARSTPAGILNLAITDVVAEVGDALTVMSDLCLDEFTDHGHCGVLTPDGRVDNDRTLEVYAEMALAQADAGVDMVGPSGMMDGQVGVVRAALDAAEHTDVSILAYSAKYASAFFGPFREAVDSSLAGRPPHLPAGPRQRPRGRPRGAARRRRGRRRRDGQAGAGLPRRACAGCATPSTSRSRRTTSPVSTPWSRPPPPTAGSTARPRSWRPYSIRRAGADVVLTYWAAEAARLLAR